MNISDLANNHILEQPVYLPGKPIEQVATEYGLNPREVCKLASNENPLGPSPKALAAAERALRDIRLYPEGGGLELREKIAKARNIRAEQIVLGNGSNEIIELLGHVFLQPGDEIVTGQFSFVVYKLVAHLFGAKAVEVPMPEFRHDLEAMKEAISDKTRLVFLASPNNPTGTANAADEIIRFAEGLPKHIVFCLDEAYSEYLELAPNLLPLIEEGRNIICLRTFSKIHGLAGLRLGYGYSSEAMAAVLNKSRQPFNANSIAQAAGQAALGDEKWTTKCRQVNKAGLSQLERGFSDLGLEYVPSQANFILVKVGNGEAIFAELQKHGVIVRAFGGGLSEYIRLTVGTREQNIKALDSLNISLANVSMKNG
ncbi:MAG: histidinol-phosphate transaminase [Opitutae bacterium]|nr:histidinol-phosphate transaminase [Opitutae bacterium]|tara:strand:+ start:4694 stop:5803 length:1110 start_codon:yes stop_codon:yes gene_type:complete